MISIEKMIFTDDYGTVNLYLFDDPNDSKKALLAETCLDNYLNINEADWIENMEADALVKDLMKKHKVNYSMISFNGRKKNESEYKRIIIFQKSIGDKWFTATFRESMDIIIAAASKMIEYYQNSAVAYNNR
jgi:adenine C2-methylase RlmN of 23S rRNA A2503 and tRNA A37